MNFIVKSFFISFVICAFANIPRKTLVGKYVCIFGNETTDIICTIFLHVQFAMSLRGFISFTKKYYWSNEVHAN